MAADVEIAKALSESLAAMTFSKAADVYFSHDVFTEAKDLSSEAVVQISLAGLARVRLARGSWAKNVALRVTVKARQQLKKPTDEVDAWLDFLDEVATKCEELAPAQKKAGSIDATERFDAQQLQNNSVFISTFTVNYPIA
ncbi:MAG: hypothetical protein AAFX06_14955 [Planctomycetota bacterium]